MSEACVHIRIYLLLIILNLGCQLQKSISDHKIDGLLSHKKTKSIVRRKYDVSCLKISGLQLQFTSNLGQSGSLCFIHRGAFFTKMAHILEIFHIMAE